MENIMLLSALFAEFADEMFERTMHIDDIKAIERVSELIANEFPRIETERRNYATIHNPRNSTL